MNMCGRQRGSLPDPPPGPVSAAHQAGNGYGAQERAQAAQAAEPHAGTLPPGRSETTELVGLACIFWLMFDKLGLSIYKSYRLRFGRRVAPPATKEEHHGGSSTASVRRGRVRKPG